MLLHFIRRRDTLQRALQAAVASHRAPLLRALYARHGDSAFAAALAAAPGRVIADALSMLAPADRVRVQRKLPRIAQHRCEEAGGQPPPAACSSEQPPAGGALLQSLFGRLGRLGRTPKHGQG